MDKLWRRLAKRKYMISVIASFWAIFLTMDFAHAKRDQYIKDSDFVNTGFFYDYSGLMEGESESVYEKNVAWEQTREGLKLSQYKKVIILDFSNTSGMAEGVTLRKAMPDYLAETLKTLDLLFTDIKRSSEKIEPKDYTKIKSLAADVIIMGNIKKIVKGDMVKREVRYQLLGFAGGDVPEVTLELKLVDRRTGEEVVRIVDVNTKKTGLHALSGAITETTTEEAAKEVIKRIIYFLLKKA